MAAETAFSGPGEEEIGSDYGPPLHMHNPIRIRKPADIDAQRKQFVAALQRAGHANTDAANPGFDGIIAESCKMRFIEAKFGKKGTEFTLGEREYIGGTAIQRQDILLPNGDKKTLYFDFAEFGERF